jgi:hypothetical protein
MIARLLALFALAVPLLATTVSGTVTDAQGNNITGTAAISWPSFVEPGGELVIAGSVRVAITDGALSVAIAPNVGSTPSGTSYSVRITSSNGKFSTSDTWVVPDAPTATIASVRTAVAPTPSAFISLSSLSTAGVGVGDILTAQAGPTWARLAKGSEGQVLSIVSGVPAWAAASSGAFSIDELTDVTATPTSHNIIYGDGTAWLSGNILTRVAAAGLDNGRMPYVSGGSLMTTNGPVFDTASADFGSTGSARGPRIRLNATGSCSSTSYSFRQDPTTGIISDTASTMGFCLGGNSAMRLGGTQTLLVQDATATTGDTKFVVKAGAGQSSNLLEVQDASGAVMSGVAPSGRFISPTATPSAATDACTANTYWFDANYGYFCNASGDIRRWAIATW